MIANLLTVASVALTTQTDNSEAFNPIVAFLLAVVFTRGIRVSPLQATGLSFDLKILILVKGH